MNTIYNGSFIVIYLTLFVLSKFLSVILHTFKQNLFKIFDFFGFFKNLMFKNCFLDDTLIIFHDVFETLFCLFYFFCYHMLFQILILYGKFLWKFKKINKAQNSI